MPIPIHLARTLACAATLGSLFLAPVAFGVDRPGVGVTPAFICLKTTITEKGHTRMSSITRHSGNLRADRNALKFARMLKYVDEQAVEREPTVNTKSIGTTGFDRALPQRGKIQ